MVSSLWRILREGFRAWLKSDAVRSSPTDRLWLSVKPPCLILWQGERIEVLARKEIPNEMGVLLQFDCLTPRGRETLRVQPGGLHQPPCCEWLNQGSEAGGQGPGRSIVADSPLP